VSVLAWVLIGLLLGWAVARLIEVLEADALVDVTSGILGALLGGGGALALLGAADLALGFSLVTMVPAAAGAVLLIVIRRLFALSGAQ
jgi:uncharacterized membrane protein YeaQ/YmgE (transglycosylase-associated protein family)